MLDIEVLFAEKVQEILALKAELKNAREIIKKQGKLIHVMIARSKRKKVNNESKNC